VACTGCGFSGDRPVGYRSLPADYHKSGDKLRVFRGHGVHSVQCPPSNQVSPELASQPGYSCEAIIDKQTGCYVDSLCGRFMVNSPEEQDKLLNGAAVSAIQISPCTMELKIGSYAHIVPYHYPINGSSPRLRIARKSHYIEVRHMWSNLPFHRPITKQFIVDYCSCLQAVRHRRVFRRSLSGPWNT
jgi:hypothetical protein